MFKITRNIVHSKVIFLLILAMILGPMTIYGDNHIETIQLEDLLPNYNNFQWTYFGSVEYGHDMAIDHIEINPANTHYDISGRVHDMSGGEAETDFSIHLEYIVESDVIIQSKNEEAMLDSKYDSIEIIRTPLVQGNTWNQDVENPDGTMTSLISTITEVEETEDGMIFTVRYEDSNSDYYEERKIQEGKGVITFTKLMDLQEDAYLMGYSINEDHSGLTTNFEDLSNNQWYFDVVSKLKTMKLVEGYPDGIFKANRDISVAEFVKVTIESLSYYPEMPTMPWYNFYISKAQELELVEENEFSEYNRPIRRDEMTKIIVKALGANPVSGSLGFSDENEIDSEYLPYIYTALELGVISGYPSDNTFRADQKTTRAEASKLFAKILEHEINVETFNARLAFNLESEFSDRLFQETEEDSWVVKNFDDLNGLIDHMSEVTDRQLATTYIENYYDYNNGTLTLPPKDGPTLVVEDRAYQIYKIHPRAYRLVQEITTEMVGHYTLTIAYRYENNSWIIEDRDVEVH